MSAHSVLVMSAMQLELRHAFVLHICQYNFRIWLGLYIPGVGIAVGVTVVLTDVVGFTAVEKGRHRELSD